MLIQQHSKAQLSTAKLGPEAAMSRGPLHSGPFVFKLSQELPIGHRGEGPFHEQGVNP